MSFTYNNDGLRTTKTVNGVTTTYYYQGSLLIAEETNLQIIVYLYDSNGAPIGFKYRGSSYASGAWDIYGYEKNLQGDIIGVYDTSTGNKLIAYKYNAWGTCTTSYYNSGMNTTATKNPFKYRGYYYDVNLGLYYLQSRYYDQNTGRFINADSQLNEKDGMLGYNVFAYCHNNPVMFADYNGKTPVAIYAGTALLVLFTVFLIAQVANAVQDQSDNKSSDNALGGISSELTTDINLENDIAYYTVYALQDPVTLKIQYVGRTKNPQMREKAHKASKHRGHLNFIVLEDGLNKFQARGLEQYYMIVHHTLNAFNEVNNQINGISLSNPMLGIYSNAAVNYLENVVSNEFLEWAGL